MPVVLSRRTRSELPLLAGACLVAGLAVSLHSGLARAEKPAPAAAITGNPTYALDGGNLQMGGKSIGLTVTGKPSVRYFGQKGEGLVYVENRGSYDGQSASDGNRKMTYLLRGMRAGAVVVTFKDDSGTLDVKTTVLPPATPTAALARAPASQ